MYKVLLERKVQKKFAKISNPFYTKLKTAILDLGQNPRPKGYIKLRGRNAYRIRVADYRIIYKITDSELIVSVIKLGHRKDIYK